MSDLQFNDRPELRRPVLVTAFSGWNDAGEAATSAIRFMARRWRGKHFAEIDPEPYYDFTQVRPTVKLERGERVIEWPPNRFIGRKREDRDRDLVLLQGTEPHLAWHHYVDCVIEFCREYRVSAVVTLGALLSEVSHAHPVRVSGGSSDEELAAMLGLGPRTASRYEGPTGIVGVLGQALRDEGIPTASVWANMPFYVQRSPNPKGSLAILERLNSGFGLDMTLHDLEVFAARFDAQVAADLARNPELAEFARRLEDDSPDEDDEPAITPPEDVELPDAQSMVDELERFLRGQRGEDDRE
ncbi:MAG: PAC2 family protein [Dehalococcoidia bacterium]|nr:PAC2 family protein [Dehalococcoidia bacterium]